MGTSDDHTGPIRANESQLWNFRRSSGEEALSSWWSCKAVDAVDCLCLIWGQLVWEWNWYRESRAEEGPWWQGWILRSTSALCPRSLDFSVYYANLLLLSLLWKGFLIILLCTIQVIAPHHQRKFDWGHCLHHCQHHGLLVNCESQGQKKHLAPEISCFVMGQQGVVVEWVHINSIRCYGLKIALKSTLPLPFFLLNLSLIGKSTKEPRELTELGR